MTENDKLLYRDLTQTIISAFYAVYNALGYGFLENVYASALSLELRKRGISVEREVLVQVYYSGQPIAHYRIDMLVNRTVVVEIKCGTAIGEPDRKQLFNYLRSTELKVGLLLHFGPKPAFKRVISTAKDFITA